MQRDKGRIQWLHRVVDRYQGPLIQYARSIIGDLDRARDVVQDTFLRLCEQDPAAIEKRVASWLFTVCRNRALDVQRKDSRIVFCDEVLMENESVGLTTPASETERLETKHRIETALGSLSERHREVIWLKFQQGLSYREIGEITNLSESNVGFILHMAIKSLRKAFLSMENTDFKKGKRHYEIRS